MDKRDDEIRCLRIALEFYAEPSNWLPKVPGEPHTDLVANGDADGWLIAQTALKYA